MPDGSPLPVSQPRSSTARAAPASPLSISISSSTASSSSSARPGTGMAAGAASTSAVPYDAPPATPTASMGSGRNLSRQASYSYAMQSVGALPLYSPRSPSGGVGVWNSAASARASLALSPRSRQDTATRDGRKGEGDGDYGSEDEDEDEDKDDSDDDDDDDDEVNDLEMDTLNKNSQGRGGWKMIGGNHHHANANGALSSPHLGGSSAPSSPTHRQHRSSSDHSPTSPKKSGASTEASPNRNFEPFQLKEWLVMGISLICVTLLTVVALHICFL